MSHLEQLTRSGLPMVGSSARLTVAGRSVDVEVDETGESVRLRARVECPALRDPISMERAGLGGKGDTTLGIDGSALVAARTLIEPSPGALYDGVWELAKAALAGALLVEDLRELEQLQAASSDVATVPSPVAVAPEPAAAPGAPRWWGSVVVATPILSGDATRTPVATLRPGQWYAVLDEQGGWLLVDDGAGTQGWIGDAQLRRGS